MWSLGTVLEERDRMTWTEWFSHANLYFIWGGTWTCDFVGLQMYLALLWVDAKSRNSFDCYLVELLYEDTGVYFIKES